MKGIHEGAWRGIFLHKNELGTLMTLSCIVTLCSFSIKRDIYIDVLKILLVLTSAFLVFMSGSRGSWVMLLSLSIAIPLLKYFYSNKSSRIVKYGLIIILILFVGLIFLNLQTLIQVIGRDLTLSGRTLLWASVFKQALMEPFFGYGYDSFWLGWNGPSRAIWKIYDWYPPHSHNGILDLWLELGSVGVFLFFAGYIAGVKRASQMLTESNTIHNLWPIIFFVFLFMGNFAYSYILESNNIYWVIYVALLSLLVLRENKNLKVFKVYKVN
jgi:O-antigen ligase